MKHCFNPLVYSGTPIPVRKRYRQLRFEIDDLHFHYEMVFLRFKINRDEVVGILNGSVTDWLFQSDSPAFLKIVPSGKLFKYALWTNGIPKQLDRIYKGLSDAAFKAGYDLTEKEEVLAW